MDLYVTNFGHTKVHKGL